MTDLDTYLKSRADRCSGCGYHVATQGCACAAFEAADAGMSHALTSRPSDASAVEQAIRTLAAAGTPFSANDARQLHGVRGGVVGATFNALRHDGVIVPVGSEASTDKGTHGKPVALWIGAAA